MDCIHPWIGWIWWDYCLPFLTSYHCGTVDAVSFKL